MPNRNSAVDFTVHGQEHELIQVTDTLDRVNFSAFLSKGQVISLGYIQQYDLTRVNNVLPRGGSTLPNAFHTVRPQPSRNMLTQLKSHPRPTGDSGDSMPHSTYKEGRGLRSKTEFQLVMLRSVPQQPLELVATAEIRPLIPERVLTDWQREQVVIITPVNTPDLANGLVDYIDLIGAQAAA
eukprot:TRINITY_DN3580_c0_g3_i1.p4 TRINITY_DN3580_c0_g3~~TRINITY_DN3580_c0_g3_i1.p4  ORF type:complete len:182 (+),score=7.67 TRINITY_DN3580_c0_g3_i1:2161-2706(+)